MFLYQVPGSESAEWLKSNIGLFQEIQVDFLKMSTSCIQDRFKTHLIILAQSYNFFTHPAQDKDAIEKHVKHKHGDAHSKKTHLSCWKVHHLNIWGVGSLSVLLSQQENKRAAAASSQPATYSHIAVTSKELNINALLCIDWKYTCHHNGLLDISE